MQGAETKAMDIAVVSSTISPEAFPISCLQGPQRPTLGADRQIFFEIEQILVQFLRASGKVSSRAGYCLLSNAVFLRLHLSRLALSLGAFGMRPSRNSHRLEKRDCL
ncbi:hypothetical protein RGR602_PB00190 (plasmid) [Rhizobium gallicum bv. gallicum R602sp]|uniref:Uncharacterized protein n=1 Tax=Rhizobium gallicum bv. gallicum R602sp TaxID=1041138 RepID=A0A0B4XB06_9HYPH|nr:hypothetical protein RGR602_PB00190 [Rhizobium gallicum bv. gallicum R602sp]